MSPHKQPKSIEKLKKLLSKTKPSILHFPDDLENSIHWVFGILVILIVIFIFSVVLTSNNGVQEYLSLLS